MGGQPAALLLWIWIAMTLLSEFLLCVCVGGEKGYTHFVSAMHLPVDPVRFHNPSKATRPTVSVAGK